jgi:BlaI family penicillinase repressor
MQKLATREEQIMQAFWEKEKAFIRDIIPLLPEPRPHYNSVATIVKILEEKGFLDHDVIGNMYEYYPLISKQAYQKHAFKDFVSRYFNNSYSNMFTFFAREQKISEQELKDLLSEIKKQKK